MGRALIIINSNADRERAASWARKAPAGTRIEFKASKRSLPQNDRMWAMLTDVADQLKWHGVKLFAEDWKLIFLDALKREVRVVPNIDGTGFVNLGRSSSDLSKDEMSDLMELISEFGARHGVRFNEPSGETVPTQASPGEGRGVADAPHGPASTLSAAADQPDGGGVSSSHPLPSGASYETMSKGR